MAHPFFYCSQLSSGAAEQTFGTASVGDLWLLVEYPHRWGPKAFHDSTLSAEVKSHLNGILKTIPRARLLLIKQKPSHQQYFTFFIVRCCEGDPTITEFKLNSYEQLLDINVASYGAGNTVPGGSAWKKPLYLVCTHGRRDKCCAKFGYPIYRSLKESADGSVWQSSHVGGDRFAANLICFPHGLFYGHVTEETCPGIVSEYEARRLVLDGYRGRACYSHPAQAAEFYIRRESGITAIGELRYLDSERWEEKAWRVKFVSQTDGRVHEAQVTARLSEFQNYVTCHSTEEKRVIEYMLNEYRVTDSDHLHR